MHLQVQSLRSNLQLPKSEKLSTMAAPIAKALICAFLSLIFASSALAASSDVPFVLAHKKATLTRLKSGAERVAVSIDIYNEGLVSVYDVSLIDSSWQQDMFDVVSGNISKSWERLDAGASLSHSFELESKIKGVYHGAPALIKFRVPTKAALQEAYSTPTLPLDILADRPPEKKFEWAKRLLAKYGSQISVVSIIVLFIYLVASPSKSGSSKGSKKKR